MQEAEPLPLLIELRTAFIFSVNIVCIIVPIDKHIFTSVIIIETNDIILVVLSY